MNQTPRARAVLDHVAPDGTPFLKAVVERMIAGRLPRTTVLAVCPNSEAVTRAALRVGKAADTPVVFAATLNQIDTDGGYTGWTPGAFVRFVEEEAARIDLDTPILPGLDHGGPWLKDAHNGLTLDETMGAVRHSLEACLDAGYAHLHVDPTVDRTLPEGARVPTARVVERTLDLIGHAEAYRQRRGRAPVSYEVGTEEVHGGLADVTVFERFLRDLDAGLEERGLAYAWPSFVVGKVGTDLHTTAFDAEVARDLTARVRPFGALVKGHYSDSVERPEAYPLAGMGGANVGPEFTEAEVRALDDLATLERTLGKDSRFMSILTDAVVESRRWTKWLRPHEQGLPLGALTRERQGWIIRTGARYVWADPAVEDARQRLYANVEGTRDADAFVLSRIEASIHSYVSAFHLAGLNARLLEGSPIRT